MSDTYLHQKQQSSVQDAQNSLLTRNINHPHKPPGALLYGLNSLPSLSGLSPQSPMPSSTVSHAGSSQPQYNETANFNSGQNFDGPVSANSGIFLSRDICSNNLSVSSESTNYSMSDPFTRHIENKSFNKNKYPNVGSVAPLPVENGPFTSPVYMQTKASSIHNPSVNVNGDSESHSEHFASVPSVPQWTSPAQMSPQGHSSMLTKQLPATGVSPNLSMQGVLYASSENMDSKAKLDANMVPSSAGLPLPYNSPIVPTSSPQVTPGPSQPPSARSSRNPSPISTQRYDYMEGQFSNKPSPSNSASNLENMAHSPSGLNVPQYPTNYLSSANNANTYTQPGSFSPSGQNYLGMSGLQNVSPMVPQPVRNNILQPGGMTPVPSPARPRYPHPQQIAYSQTNQPTSPVLTSQPGSLQPPPQPMFNTPNTQQSQMSPFLMQTNVPDGPVGGVAGYDPQLHSKMAGMSVHSSFSRLWGNESVNLLQDKNILPPVPLEPLKPVLSVDRPNCSSDIFRCTLTKIPESSSLLQKSRLPFGILIHPFRDVLNLPVIQCNTIVRCRNCRTYINPFVTFVDQRRWKCNLCFRVNDLPEEFLYDPVTRSYGDPSRRPEVKNATMEFIAPSDYMLRPPQPAAYLFVLDVSHGACDIGYLEVFCKTLLDHLDELPGDSRTRIGFITFDGSIHFYNLAEGLNQPHMLIVSDIKDTFLPSPDNLLVNLQESKMLIRDLLEDLPKRFSSNWDSNNCLGAVLQVAYKLMSPVGGRVTVIQAGLANYGPGALKNREDPNQRAAKDVANIGPANDFYKKLSLECSSQQVAVDLYLLCSQYVDIATISCISKYSSGSIQYYPGFHHQLGRQQVERFSEDLKRYLCRRIGFEAVMRIRCTRGLAIHTFHGNFFVRSTDLLSLPNVNPDIGYGMQITIEENLTESNSVCFQAAVLYTSSNGERRIRVHTLSIPVASMLNDIWGGADQEAIVGLVAKMAVDRSTTSSLNDARDALINVSVDLLGSFKQTLQSSQTGGALVVPYSARLIPLFVLALLKHVAFRTGVSTKLDERVFAMERMKTLPLSYLMKYIYPTLYPVHALDEKNGIHQDDDAVIPQPVILQLSSEKVDRHGAYILDTVDIIYLYIGRAVNDYFCQNVLGVPNFSAIPEDLKSLPELDTPESERMRNFLSWLQEQRPAHSPLMIIREDSNARHLFLQHMTDDRTESLFSYYEFLQHLRQQISK